jgi:hypothetical protein
MTQFSQGPVKASGVDARNLIEGINNNTGSDNSFEDAGLDGGSAKSSGKACKQCCFPCTWFGQNNRDARRYKQVTFSDKDVAHRERARDVKRSQRDELSNSDGLLTEHVVWEAGTQDPEGQPLTCIEGGHHVTFCRSYSCDSRNRTRIGITASAHRSVHSAASVNVGSSVQRRDVLAMGQ